MVIHHGYKRSHYYLVLLAFTVILTGMYVFGLTEIFKSSSNKNTENPPPVGASSTVITKIFGNAVSGDIGVGTGTVAAFVTQDHGGSGTFFYAIAFVKEGDVYVNTNPIFLGDRIAPQTISISNNVASFNYYDRKLNEPFTVPPSVCATKNFSIKNGQLTEIIPRSL
ncbi:MAG: hypothetical protein WCO48_01000 [Candidatus Taylorbacteria bacterium]